MKKEILEEILKITILQKQALDEDDIELFQELMTKKQQHIDKLEEMKSKEPEIKNEDEKQLLLQIVSLDEENRKNFIKAFEEVKKKLNDMRAKKRVNAIYNNPYDVSQEEGIFFDKR